MAHNEFDNYFVSDLLYEDTKIIFILESPHIQEVKNGYALAGRSGNDVSKILFGIDESFGKLIIEQRVKNIGILNISNYPLQKSAYFNSPPRIVDYFEKIRQNPRPNKYQDKNLSLILNKMLSNFKSRLEVHKDKKIVLCGNFAQRAFESVFSESEFKAVIKVPHPSFNNWRKERYKHAIEELLKFIREKSQHLQPYSL